MAEPVTLAQAKAWCRIDDDEHDDLLNDLIVAAREWIESYTGLLLTEREVVQSFDGFGLLELRYWPIAADADVSIDYRDAAGETQTYAGARLIVGRRPATLLPAVGATWPSLSPAPGLVTIGYTAGYADAAAVPAMLKHALMMLVAYWHENRDMIGLVPMAEVANLCRLYRLPVI